MSAHPTPEELAEYAEGLLAADVARRVGGHLPGCAACRQVRADLTQLRAVLAADRPGPLPAEVAARIDAALAATAPPATALAAPERQTRRRFVRAASVAAGLVLVASGSVLGLQVLRADTPRSMSPDVGHATGPPRQGPGPALPAEPSPPYSASTGQVYTRAGFAEHVTALLKSAANGAGAPGGTGATAKRWLPGGGAATDTPTGTAPAATCAATLATQTGQPGVSPLAVDVASWYGTPALVVVLPQPGAPSAIHAYVVPRDCTGQRPGGLPVLYNEVLSRP